MRETNLKRIPGALGVAVALLVGQCGGGVTTGAKTSESGGAGGGHRAGTGGSGGDGFISLRDSGTGGSWCGDAGVLDCCVDASPCNETTLWIAVARAAGPTPCGPGWLVDGGGYETPGTITFDGDGLLVDNSGTPAASRAELLAELDNCRWPCLAGQTISYACVSFE